MGNPWFRMYTDFLEDAKMMTLAFEDQRHFIGVLALKSAGTLDQECEARVMDRIVAQKLWLDGSVIGEVKRRLIEADLISEDWQPIAWDKRQFVSDRDPSAAERARRYREKKRAEAEKEASRVTSRTRHAARTDTEQNRTDSEQKGKGAKANRFRPPSLSEVIAYCTEKRSRIDAGAFHAYYESNGWHVGKSKMRDWKAAVTTWEKRNAADRKTGSNRRNGSHATLERIAAEDDPEELGGAAVSEVHGGLRAAVDGEYRKH